MVTVTYRQLEPMDTDYPGVLSRIENYTGVRGIYGLDTPINVLDIIDNVGLDDGILTLNYAASDTLALCETLAIECLRGNMEPWVAVFPGDTRLTDLLTDIEAYIATKDTPDTPKKDYCGDDVPGFYGTIPVNQLTERLASMESSANALTLVQDYYVDSYWMAGGGVWTPAAIEYWNSWGGGGRWSISTEDQNSTDYVTAEPQNLSGYTEQNINTMLSVDPDYYFNESINEYAQAANNHNIYYGVIVNRPVNGLFGSSVVDEPMNYTNLAVQMLIDQLDLLIAMATNEANLLPGIIAGIRGYMLQYETDLRLALGVIMPRLQELKNNGAFPNLTHNAALASAEQAIINAGLNKRAELLRDASYLATYDTNLSGTLSAVERTALEVGIRAAMVDARKTLAETLFEAAEATYNGLGELSSGQRTIDIITPYLL
jgi:hypothetical protein